MALAYGVRCMLSLRCLRQVYSSGPDLLSRVVESPSTSLCDSTTWSARCSKGSKATAQARRQIHILSRSNATIATQCRIETAPLHLLVQLRCSTSHRFCSPAALVQDSARAATSPQRRHKHTHKLQSCAPALVGRCVILIARVRKRRIAWMHAW